MTRQKKVEFYTRMVLDQQRFIVSNGGDLSGYIAQYGDPGVLCTEGRRKGMPMLGNGGTAIYQADTAGLARFETLLAGARG